MQKGCDMRSSTRWLAALLILLLCGWTLALVGQAPDPSPHDGAPKAVEVSTQAPEQDSPAKAADTQRADTQSADSQSNHLPFKKSKVNWHLGTITVGAGYASGPVYGPYGYYPFGPYGYYPGDWVYSAFAYPLLGPYPFYPAGYFVFTRGR